MSFGQLEPRFDYFDIALRCLDPLLGLLLEGMKDIDNPGKTNCVDGSISIAVFIIDDLEHTAATEALQRLGTRMLIAILRVVESP